jgi:hypothetical protein
LDFNILTWNIFSCGTQRKWAGIPPLSGMESFERSLLLFWVLGCGGDVQERQQRIAIVAGYNMVICFIRTNKPSWITAAEDSLPWQKNMK